MRTARAALALLLCLAVPVRAETTSDPLWTLLSTYVLTPDPRAPGAEKGDAKGLAALQADLLLLADGFEAFRDEEQVKESLARMEPRMSPELRPYFKNRASALDAVYRTLAVTDYSWAGRLPEPPCEPVERRASLLGAEDGLFADAKGESSPWLIALLGALAKGRKADDALDQASRQARMAPAEYERLRARARRLTLALASERAEGAPRARLYCERGGVYESLAAHHRAAPIGLVEASASSASDASASVLAVVSKDRRASAVALRGKSGVVIVTDAAIVEDTDEPLVFYAGPDGQAVSVHAKVQRRLPALGLAELELSEARPALPLAPNAPAKGDLVRVIGHSEVTGLWTKSSGLVTKSADASFQTDAALSPDFSGAPVLDESGAVAGLLVLRKADTEEGRWPVAVPAPLLARWMEGEELAAVEPAAETIEDAGTAAILTRAAPAPIESGLGAWHIPNLPPPPPTVQGVCVSGCNIPSAPRRSYSRHPPSFSGGSSYSPGAEMGAELGKALAPLVEALVFQGIPALFRGIGSLFKKKPGSRPAAHVAEKKVEKRPVVVKQDPPQPPPPPKPAVCSVSIVSAPDSVGARPAEIVASVGCVGGEAPLAGHQLTFSVQWDGGPVVTAGSADTNEQGQATLQLTVENESTKRMEAVGRAQDSLDELDLVAREHADVEEAVGEEESFPQPAGQLIETQATVAVGEGRAGATTAKAATVAAGSRVALKLKTSGRALRVLVNLTRLARVARVAGVASAPTSGGLSLGITVASTVLLFEVERALTKALKESKEDECALKPGETILDRFIDGSRLGKTGYLYDHEGSGHTIGRHVGKSIAYLNGRLGPPENRLYASSFDDIDVAENAIRRAVGSNLPAVEAWGCRRNTSRLDVHFLGPSPARLGVVLEKRDASREPRASYTAEARLLQRADCRIFILSAFPTPR